MQRNNQEEIARQDAARIASWIHWVLKGNYKVSGKGNGQEREGPEAPTPGDFMVLARYKAHLPIYARALEEHGIPYEISGGGAFRESAHARTKRPCRGSKASLLKSANFTGGQ